MSKIDGVSFKYVRQVFGFNSEYWCDCCRVFTDAPKNHPNEGPHKREGP